MRSKLCFLIALSFVSLAAALVASAETETSGPSAWDMDPVAWRSEGKAFVCANAGRALAPAPKGRRVEISARVTPQQASNPEYASVGVGVFDDLDRYWNFALLKGPDAKGAWLRYELKAQSRGEWGAEERLMKLVENKRSAEWTWGQTLDLRLSFTPDRIEGVVSDAATGKELYRCVRVLRESGEVGERASRPSDLRTGKMPVPPPSDAESGGELAKGVVDPPVPAGRPCLFVSGDLRGRVENVRFSVGDEVPEKTRDFPAYRPVGPETGIRGKATGYFHMETIDGVDWAIDPLGRGVLLVGTDWCNPRGCHCEALGYSIYGRWVKSHYPSTEAWAEETAARLGDWGFTFLPCGGDESLYYRTLAHANAADRIYFSHHMCRGDPDWRIAEYRPAPCTAFPNVFHPDFEKACDWWARQRCAPYRDDPWLVGYFIDNELAWWGDVGANKAGGLFDLVAKKPDTHPAKKALAAFLAERGASLREVSTETKIAFLRLAAERYFAATAGAIRRADPNHMVLGCRFAGGPNGVHPVVMEVAGKYCDIVSFNHYPWANLDQKVVFDSRSNQTPVVDLYREAHDRAKKPLFLTEWSFPALDAGMPCTQGAGQRFYTQAERVQASELYARTLLSLPFFAGYSYFRWVDQPPLGIRKTFPENSNYGLVSEQGVPYEGLTAMFSRVQRSRQDMANDERLKSDELRVTSDESRAAKSQVPLSEHDRFFAAAAEKLVSRHSSPVTSGSVGFRQEADGTWSLSNGLVRLSGRIGGKYMADEIAYSDAPAVGRWGALLEGELDGIPYWTDVSRVTDVSFSLDEATGIGTIKIRAEGTSRAGSAGGVAPELLAFAFTHRLSLAPGSADVLAEIVSLENIGTDPFKVKFLFMRPFAIQTRPGETDTVPNLWKGPVEDYWTLDDGSRWGVASYDPGVLNASLWYREGDKSQHPDVRCREGEPFTLEPGKTFRPSVPMGARIRFIPADTR